ncbi:putative cytochrome P450 [Aspergillus steynii IBT 23096]|uniref:Putative cytochrome P450 n=1 Tax=Aspergillus steynii IBT 23096 TaxID=1392250 RepID=A0A2I2G6J9_9EURO|nr:putative cytochrome P450 [Aspergillus steynii IBT 23096]PLB48501.1 putative cytochrome P450 [Aspergillus steynii IBT 23096]
MATATTLTALTSPLSSQISPTFFFLGVAFHQCIRTTEIDNQVWSLAGLYLGSWLTLCVVYSHGFALSWVTAAGWATFAACVFNAGLTTSIIIYRAFFHRLRHFPGPWTLRLSRLFIVQRVLKRTQFHLNLETMHHKYGDFVRTGPREISINRPSAVYAVNGPHSPCTRGTWYSHVSADNTKVSLNSTRNPDDHRLRRRAWDRGFSVKALATYELSVYRKVNVLISQLRSRLNQPVDATQWTMYYAFDTMGLIGFSKDFSQLEDGTEHAAIKDLHDQMLVLGFLKPVPWIFTILGTIQGLVGHYGQFMTYSQSQMAEKKSKWIADEEKSPKDVISWLLKASDENDQSAPPGDQALNEDGRLMLIAGSDTTAATLAHALYYLVKNQAVLKRLQLELDNAFSDHSGADLSTETLRTLPYLEAIINETLRLKPPVPSGQPRMTPPEGLQIDEVWIPGETIVIVSQHVMHRDDRYFPSADEFIPERWLDRKEKLITDEEAFFPFQLGRYGCVGKQFALMQLRSVIARIAIEFNLSFADGEDGVSFDRDSKDTFTMTVGPLNLVFSDRERCRSGEGVFLVR